MSTDNVLLDCLRTVIANKKISDDSYVTSAFLFDSINLRSKYSSTSLQLSLEKLISDGVLVKVRRASFQIILSHPILSRLDEHHPSIAVSSTNISTGVETNVVPKSEKSTRNNRRPLALLNTNSSDNNINMSSKKKKEIKLDDESKGVKLSLEDHIKRYGENHNYNLVEYGAQICH